MHDLYATRAARSDGSVAASPFLLCSHIHVSGKGEAHFPVLVRSIATGVVTIVYNYILDA